MSDEAGPATGTGPGGGQECAAAVRDHVERQEPEPDVAVAEGSDDDYMSRLPRARDLHLICEVADSSLLLDRTHKLRVYARARIPIYWIVNLQDNRIEVYTQPRGGRTPAYQRREDYSPGQEIPVVINDREVARLRVSDL